MKTLQSLAKLLIRYPNVVTFARNILGSSFLNNRKIYGRFCLASARRLNDRSRYGNLQLNIETTLVCNAKCLMCTRNSMSDKSGVMNQSIFEKIVNEAAEIGVRKIILSVFGEPLADKNFISRARFVDERNIPFMFYSNGSLMTEKKARALLALQNFKRVNFSVNAFDAPVYDRVMIGLNREVVYENILRFLKIRKDLGSKVKVRISGVVFEETKDQTKKLYNFWSCQPGVDNVYFPVLRNRAGATIDLEAKYNNIEYSPLSRKGNVLHPCRFLWEDLYIYWDGKVGVCCEDTALRRLIIGDLNSNSLKDIWLGDKINNIRQLHLDGKRLTHPICGKSCTYNSIWVKP